MRVSSPGLLLALALGCATETARAQVDLYSDDFEQGTSNWTVEGHWIWADESVPCGFAVLPYPSGSRAMRFGSPTGCDFYTQFDGALTLNTPVALPSAGGSLELGFWTLADTEDWSAGEWDAKRVLVSTDDGASWSLLPLIHSSPWYRHVYDLTSFAGASIRVRFEFDAVDGYDNGGLGWFLDDVRITSRAEPGVPFCFGDFCPCGNTTSGDGGCANSFDAAGARLASSGTASVSADDVLFTAAGLSNTTVTFFQGTTSTYDFLTGSALFGDGQRCVNGTVVRIAAVQASGGAAFYPSAGDLPISVRGAVPPGGGRRTYQVWYRNAAPFCTSFTFNVSNALSVTWSP
jgi:hypothetical protein